MSRQLAIVLFGCLLLLGRLTGVTYGQATQPSPYKYWTPEKTAPKYTIKISPSMLDCVVKQEKGVYTLVTRSLMMPPRRTVVKATKTAMGPNEYAYDFKLDKVILAEIFGWNQAMVNTIQKMDVVVSFQVTGEQAKRFCIVYGDYLGESQFGTFTVEADMEEVYVYNWTSCRGSNDEAAIGLKPDDVALQVACDTAANVSSHVSTKYDTTRIAEVKNAASSACATDGAGLQWDKDKDISMTKTYTNSGAKLVADGKGAKLAFTTKGNTQQLVQDANTIVTAPSAMGMAMAFLDKLTGMAILSFENTFEVNPDDRKVDGVQFTPGNTVTPSAKFSSQLRPAATVRKWQYRVLLSAGMVWNCGHGNSTSVHSENDGFHLESRAVGSLEALTIKAYRAQIPVN